jgi:hypothetical protein
VVDELLDEAKTIVAHVRASDDAEAVDRVLHALKNARASGRLMPNRPAILPCGCRDGWCVHDPMLR